MTDEALGQVALVTGGSRGIGRAITEASGKRGVKVAINRVTNELAAQKALEGGRAGGGPAKRPRQGYPGPKRDLQYSKIPLFRSRRALLRADLRRWARGR